MLSRGVDLDIFVQLYAVWLVLIPGFGPLKYLRRLGGWKRLGLGRLVDSLSGAFKYQGLSEAALSFLSLSCDLFQCISHNFLWRWLTSCYSCCLSIKIPHMFLGRETNSHTCAREA